MIRASMIKLTAAVCILVLALAACSVGPDNAGEHDKGKASQNGQETASGEHALVTVHRNEEGDLVVSMGAEDLIRGLE